MKWLGSLALVVAICGCGNKNTGNDGGGVDMTMSGDDLASGDGGDTGQACDPGKQTGCTTGQRCVIKVVGTGMNQMLAPRCVNGGGTTAIGSTCTRGPGGAGDDDCVDGGQCTSISNATGVFACRHLCSADADCSGGAKCYTITSDFKYGYCLQPCDPFSGTACPAQQTCALSGFGIGTALDAMMMNFTTLNGFYVCRSIGTMMLPQGGDCSANFDDRDCAAGLVCNLVDATCQPICDNTHACPGANMDGGDQCFSYDNFAATTGLGFCAPQ